ncbi:MAG: alpha-1,2-fucosyltransferase [Acidobacteriales bacterium]|nr:alpha-1,2-fucosyltransferase [Terriglobales bacterium]
MKRELNEQRNFNFAAKGQLMVIVKLIGGLGNQMFQYALGRSLAISRDDRLFLHLEALSPSFTINSAPEATARSFALDVFNIEADITTLERLQSERANVIWTMTESGFGFFSEVFSECKIHRNVGVVGWWQSEKYFLENAETISNDFQFKDSYKSPYPASIAEQITQSDSVCLHIRRTDVLKDEDPKGPVELGYYARAIEAIHEQLPGARVFVFSDDIHWCKEELSLPLPMTFVSSESTDQLHPADDLYLMSLCRHFVIANSTYSWWAAWLAKNPEKIVIAPRTWYRADDPAFKGDSYLTSADLVPNRWIRV